MRLPVIFFFLLLGACSQSPVVKLYEGAERPAAELVTVRVPVELEILTINDRRIEGAGTMFSFGSRELMLEPGRYRILAYYKSLFQLTGDEHEVVKSDPVFFTLDGKAGERFVLGFDRPADVEEARRLARHFDGWVKNQATGETFASTPSGLVVTSGFMGVLNQGGATEPPVAAAVAPADAGAPASDTLEALKQGWQRATPEERREFLLWMSR